MRVNPTVILRELDRRKQAVEERAAPKKLEQQELAAQYEKEKDAYLALSWWKQLFATDPKDQYWRWFFFPVFDGDSYAKEHKDLYALCRYAASINQDIELPFSYSYLLPYVK